MSEDMATRTMRELEPMFRRMQLGTMAAAALQGLLASSDEGCRDFAQMTRVAWNLAELMQHEGRLRELKR